MSPRLSHKPKLLQKIITISLIILFLFSATPASAKNISVPFTTQAPYSYWGQPWQDACEETTTVMVDNFYRGKLLDTKQKAKEEILKNLNIKNKAFGWSLDENVEQMVKLINEFLPWEARTVENPTLEQIKNEIDNNHPIIIPTHGRYLYNPHFGNGGSDYHTVVLTGYDDNIQEFIVQEPGTRHGQNYHYAYKTILNAMHDFLPGYQTKNGPKIAIFTQRGLSTSKDADGDADGLKKSEELKHGTITWLYDSDGDGFSDGEEVKAGFSPTIAEVNIPNGSLIKALNNSKVFLFKNNNKQHILNEQVFLKHGWLWNQIKTVSTKFLKNLPEKEVVSN